MDFTGLDLFLFQYIRSTTPFIGTTRSTGLGSTCAEFDLAYVYAIDIYLFTSYIHSTTPLIDTFRSTGLESICTESSRSGLEHVHANDIHLSLFLNLMQNVVCNSIADVAGRCGTE